MASQVKWIRETVLPSIVSHNWPGGCMTLCDVGECHGGNATDGGFASNTFSLVLHVKEENNDHDSVHHLLAKLSMDNKQLFEMFSSDKQFENETNWYTEIVPTFESLANKIGSTFCAKLMPRCFLCLRESSSNQNAIIMQNLKHEGFGLARQPSSALDTEHAVLALERLAYLHALGYTLKCQQPDLYKKYVGNIHDTMYLQGMKNTRDFMLKASVERGIAPLRHQQDYSELVSIVDQVFGDSPYSFQMEKIRPSKPSTDVLCHGDFCRNNVLYRYNDNGKVCDARLIDFATFRESSPGADISFFLYISVSEETREGEGLRYLLSRYHSTLVSTLFKLNGPCDPWQGDLNALEQEVGSYVLFTYCICSFFLPVMMVDGSEFNLEKHMRETPEVQNKINITLGGEATTQRLTNILLDSYKRGFHKLWKRV